MSNSFVERLELVKLSVLLGILYLQCEKHSLINIDVSMEKCFI